MRSARFESWYSRHVGISLAEVADMWNGRAYVSHSFYVEIAWDAWCEAINGVVP